MARRKERKASAPESGWLITFCDMMTLLLTFFVLLISMASLVDEVKRLKVLDSVYVAFGIDYQGSWDDETGTNVLSSGSEKMAGEAGPYEDLHSFEVLKPLLFESPKHDLQLVSNRFMQVFSVNAELLFERGRAALSREGRAFLGKMAPLLREIDYPIMISGHTAMLRDEFGSRSTESRKGLDASWKLSLDRVAAVYGLLVEQGLEPEKIRIEGYGRFAPRFTNNTPEGRDRNRRVDFILDKRAASWAHLAAKRIAPRETDREFRYKGFLFDSSINGTLGKRGDRP